MAEVSIIIPTKNRPRLLARAVNSVIKQKYQNWELLIVNDSEINLSNNFSDHRIQITNNNNKPGANGARNTGINLAKGKYIAFLDDDDTWGQEKLLKQVQIMDATKSLLCYTGKNIIIRKENISIKKYSYKTCFISPKITLQLQNYIGTTSSVIIRSDVFNDIIKFDEEINSLQDYDLYLKLVDKGEIAGIPEGLVTYYFDDSIKHISVNNKAMFFSAWKIYRKQRGYARLSILIALLVIIIQKYYKKIYYKHKGKNL